MNVILGQIHSHIFILMQQIQRKINILKKRKTFWNQYEIVKYEILQDQIWEGVDKESQYEKLLCKTLGERALVNNLPNIWIPLGYFFMSSVVWRSKFKMKKKKYVVLLLPFFILLVSIWY